MDILPFIPANAVLLSAEADVRSAVDDIVQSFLKELRIPYLRTTVKTVVLDEFKLIICMEIGTFSLTSRDFNRHAGITFTPSGVLDHFSIADTETYLELKFSRTNPLNGIYLF